MLVYTVPHCGRKQCGMYLQNVVQVAKIIVRCNSTLVNLSEMFLWTQKPSRCWIFFCIVVFTFACSIFTFCFFPAGKNNNNYYKPSSMLFCQQSQLTLDADMVGTSTIILLSILEMSTFIVMEI